MVCRDPDSWAVAFCTLSLSILQVQCVTDISAWLGDKILILGHLSTICKSGVGIEADLNVETTSSNRFGFGELGTHCEAVRRDWKRAVKHGWADITEQYFQAMKDKTSQGASATPPAPH